VGQSKGKKNSLLKYLALNPGKASHLRQYTSLLTPSTSISNTDIPLDAQNKKMSGAQVELQQIAIQQQASNALA
jgi:hypothetical protein